MKEGKKRQTNLFFSAMIAEEVFKYKSNIENIQNKIEGE